MPLAFRRALPLLAALILIRPVLCDDSLRSASGEDNFQWEPAVTQSFLAISLANIERVTTQKDTRNAIRGPFWKNYIDSLENLHGFNDGDGFFTSYVLHAMEGAFPAYIQRQNDPKYRYYDRERRCVPSGE